MVSLHHRSDAVTGLSEDADHTVNQSIGGSCGVFVRPAGAPERCAKFGGRGVPIHTHI